MGGKTKQSQRTKNNARPSSSGRSAELLSSVKLDSGIVNAAGTQLPALFPLLVAPSVDPLISPELQLCLKKLNKKDPITKTKALQELSELVANSKVDDVVLALPTWSHFYKILTEDPDRKVRECTQACHGAIVNVCGRQVAPHLKQLMPAWLQAQYDEHAPAQTHALNSLTKTFPGTKLPEVLSFCKEQIVSHLLDAIIANGETAHIRKAEGAEERAVSGSLRALQTLALRLADAHGAWLWARLRPLLRAPAFWKRAADPDLKIRAAWFGATGSLVARFKQEFGAEHGARALRLLLGGCGRDPRAAAPLWECLLLFMHNVPNWHLYLSEKELLSKRILNVLESGGWGDARQLSHMLLPILASLPEDTLTREFHLAFFDAIFSGLEKKTILSSKSERQYWITSLEECLRYLSTQSQDYVLEVVTSVHRTWLEKVLTDNEGQTRTHLLKYSASAMVNLVKYWLRQAKEGSDEKYDRLIRNFWQNVGSTLTAQIDRVPLDGDDIEKLIDAHILLLQTLKTSFTQEVKKQHSIKFEVDAQAVEREPSAGPQPADPALSARYHRHLHEVVRRACGHCLLFASAKRVSEPVISPLITLLGQFDSEGLFSSIAAEFGCDSPYRLYDEVLRGWLAEDTMRCRAVVDVVFMLMRHLSEAEQDAAFDTFEQLPPAALRWCVAQALAHPARRWGSARRWLRGRASTRAVTSLCDDVLRAPALPHRQLLLMCLDADVDGESAVSAEAIEESLRRLSASLYAVEAAELEARSGLAAQLACALPPHGALLAALLALTATLQRGDARLSPDTWCEVRDAWQDGVTSLPRAARDRFLLDAAGMLHARLNLHSNLTVKSPQTSEPSAESEDKSSGSSELNIGLMEHIVSLCPYLLWCNSELDVPEVVRFTRTIFDIAPADPMLIESYATRHEILAGNLNCPFEDNPIVKAIANDTLTELCKSDLVAHVNTVLFRMMYLRTMLLNRPDDESERNWCKELLSEEYFEAEFVKCIHDYVVICALYEGYAFWPHYKLIEQSKTRLDTLLDDIIKETNTDIRSSISNNLSELAISKGYFWAYARRYFEAQIQQSKDSSQTDTARRQNEHVISKSNQVSSQGAQDSSQNDQVISQSDQVISDQVTCQNDQASSQNNQVISDQVSWQNDQASSKNDQVVSDQVSCENDQAISQSDQVSSQSEIAINQVETASADAETKSKEVKETSQVENLLAMTNLPDIITGPTLLHTLHYLQAKAKYSSDADEILRTKFYLAVVGVYIAHAAEPAVVEGLLRDVSAQAPCSPDALVNTYYAHNHIMLYETDISNAPWKQIVSNASVCSFLQARVAEQGFASAAHHWDFTNITLCSLLTSLDLSKRNWGTAKVALLARPVLRLFGAVASFVRRAPALCELAAPPAHVAALPAEWADIYAPDLHRSLFSIILFVLESSASARALCSSRARVVHALVQCAPQLRWESLAPAQRADCSLRRLLAGCCAVLREPTHSALQYLAHAVLQALLEPLVLEDAQQLAAWGGGAEAAGGPLQLSLLHYDDAFFHLQDIVETAVSHVRVCEEVCAMVPFTDAHALTLGWLLLADIVNQQCLLARGDLAHQYIQIYREQRYAEPLLTTALRLLPASALARAASAPPAPADDHMGAFTALRAPIVYGWCGSEAVSAAACRCVWWCVRGAGAGSARGWRGAAHHKHALMLDNITRRYITPHVVKEEFALLQRKGSDIEDTEITLKRWSYEISCVLTVDDKPIELVVSLARQHPLVLPRLTADHAAAGNVNWILMYLGYQNGTILNALKMWAVSVNNKLERAPQCYICYCRLHHATGRLPDLHCHTCRNKFHNVCLRKWFLSSSKMTCPLCRANF